MTLYICSMILYIILYNKYNYIYYTIYICNILHITYIKIYYIYPSGGVGMEAIISDMSSSSDVYRKEGTVVVVDGEIGRREWIGSLVRWRPKDQLNSLIVMVSFFFNKPSGALPAVIGRLIQVKKEATKGTPLYMAAKNAVNATYGSLVCTSGGSRAPFAGAAVTIAGKTIRRSMAKAVESIGGFELYADTDSCHFTSTRIIQDSDVRDIEASVERDTGIVVRIDHGLYKRVVYYGKKKRYDILEGDGKVKSVGGARVRSNVARCVRDASNDIVREFMHRRSRGIRDVFNNFITKLSHIGGYTKHILHICFAYITYMQNCIMVYHIVSVIYNIHILLTNYLL
eukprot:GHVR01179592.1.p1 GENE.GHVR01179592.1~~GHVR01179592.1.p1  ORF type:complete len:342 (+),score=32.31 GHVR01179592.1:159-1184(+)